ncbi:putative membrane protein TerC [Thiomonas delicata]|jgi:YjbE family integral membrane protein|uniref:Putative membrane protein TerC n=1 Tax=Thiomonas delicata TaxID=364030 RepID=A0A238CZN7_THIDL|nr:putative membrane protein TerC [Thiomonas delicata]
MLHLVAVVAALRIEWSLPLPLESFLTPVFWAALGQIVLIDILLGGDNAVVIALASRKLPPLQRRKAIFWGTIGAVALRVVLIFFALSLLKLPFLKIIGAVLLLWIGVKLMQPDDEPEGGHGSVQAADKLWAAVKTVIVADLVMSLDNVIAIAGAAQNAGADHSLILVIFGLVLSVPIIVWGSQMVIGLMTRYPVIITLGAMLLGWIAGGLVVTDPAAESWVHAQSWGQRAGMLAGAAGAMLVWGIGQWIRSRHRRLASTD